MIGVVPNRRHAINNHYAEPNMSIIPHEPY